MPLTQTCPLSRFLFAFPFVAVSQIEFLISLQKRPKINQYYKSLMQEEVRQFVAALPDDPSFEELRILLKQPEHEHMLETFGALPQLFVLLSH